MNVDAIKEVITDPEQLEIPPEPTVIPTVELTRHWKEDTDTRVFIEEIERQIKERREYAESIVLNQEHALIEIQTLRKVLNLVRKNKYDLMA